MLKKLLIVALLFIPSVAFGATAVPWQITNTSDTFIFPTAVNGAKKGLLISASSTFNGPFTLSTSTAGCLQTSSTGLIFATTCASGGGAAFPFTPTTNFGALTNATSTPLWLQAGFQASSTANLDLLKVATTSATSTFAGPTQFGSAAFGDNLLDINCNRPYSASISVGGCVNIGNGSVNSGAALSLFSSFGAGATARLLTVQTNNTAFDQETATFQSVSDTRTTVGITGSSTAQGTEKITHFGYGGLDANAAALSIDNSGANTAAQGIFIDATTAGGGTGNKLTVRNGGNGVDLLVIKSNGWLGIGTSTPYAPLSVVGQVVGANFTATTTAVNRLPNVSADQLSNLTSNGFVKTSAGNGTLSIDTNTYLTSAVTSLAAGAGIAVSGSTGAVTVTNTIGYPFPSNATTTALTLGGLTITGKADGCATFATGVLNSTGSACGSGGGGSFPFSVDNTYGQVVYSTSTPTLLFKSGLFSSSTITIGAGGVGSSSVQYGPSGFEWTVGSFGVDNTFRVSSSTALAVNPALIIDKTLRTTLANLTISTTTAGCLNTSSTGVVYSATCATGGGSFPFTPTINFGVNTSATSTPIWAQSGLFASTTFIADVATIGTTTSTSTLKGDFNFGTISGNDNQIRVQVPRNYNNSSSVGGAVNITNTANAGPGLVVYSNQSASAGNLVNVRCDNATFANDCFRVDAKGTGDGISIVGTNTGTASNEISATGAGDHTAVFAYTGSNANKGALSLTSTNTTGSVLQITGAPAALGLIKASFNGIGDANSAMLSLDASASGYLGQGIFIDSSGGTWTGSKILNLRANGTEFLTLTTAGLLGLGSTTPSTQLSVQGNEMVSGTTTAGNVVATSTVTIRPLATAAGSFLAVDPIGRIIATTTPTGGTGAAYPFTPATNFGAAAQATTGIAWFQNGLQASSTSQFANTNTINATSSQLAITGNTYAIGGVYFGSGVANAKISQSSATQLDFAINRSGSLLTGFSLIDNGGIGGESIVGPNTDSPAIRFNGTNGATTPQYSFVGETNTGFFKSSGSSAIKATVTGVQQLIIGSGIFGLGTTTPDRQLSVQGDSIVSGTGTFANLIATGSIQAFASSTIGSGAQAGGLTINGGATTTGNSAVLGSVVIGTSTGELGSVNANTGNLVLYNTNTSGASPALIMGGNVGGDTDYWLGRTNNNDGAPNDYLQIGGGLVPGTGPLMTWDANRGVEGIGTTSPAFLLNLASSTAPQLSLSDGSATNAPWTFRNINSNLYIATTSLTTFATSTVAAATLSFGGQFSLSELDLFAKQGTSTNMVIDWLATPNQVDVRIGTAAVTIGFNNASTTGMTKRIVVCNPQATASTVTWAQTGSVILWSGGTSPVQTVTANKCDLYSLLTTQATSTGTTIKVLGAVTQNF